MAIPPETGPRIDNATMNPPPTVDHCVEDKPATAPTTGSGEVAPGTCHEPVVGTVLAWNRVELPDGRVLDIGSQHAPPASSRVSGTFIDHIQPFDFDTCPICLVEQPGTAEHVPPAALGGVRLTTTCADCNNKFGPLEAELSLYSRNGLKAVGFRSEGVRGQRRARQAALSFQEDGTWAVVLDRPDPAVASMLRDGALTLEYAAPARALWRTALLKHAYIAACVYLRAVPTTPHSSMIRDELLQARAAGVRHTIGPFADTIRSFRGYGPALAPAYIAAVETDGMQLAAVGLGRFGLAAWPMPDTGGDLVARITQNRRAS